MILVSSRLTISRPEKILSLFVAFLNAEVVPLLLEML